MLFEQVVNTLVIFSGLLTFELNTDIFLEMYYTFNEPLYISNKIINNIKPRTRISKFIAVSVIILNPKLL